MQGSALKKSKAAPASGANTLKIVRSFACECACTEHGDEKCAVQEFIAAMMSELILMLGIITRLVMQRCHCIQLQHDLAFDPSDHTDAQLGHG